jgi:hypothetical protein
MHSCAFWRVFPPHSPTFPNSPFTVWFFVAVAIRGNFPRLLPIGWTWWPELLKRCLGLGLRLRISRICFLFEALSGGWFSPPFPIVEFLEHINPRASDWSTNHNDNRQNLKTAPLYFLGLILRGEYSYDQAPSSVYYNGVSTVTRRGVRGRSISRMWCSNSNKSNGSSENPSSTTRRIGRKGTSQESIHRSIPSITHHRSEWGHSRYTPTPPRLFPANSFRDTAWIRCCGSTHIGIFVDSLVLLSNMFEWVSTRILRTDTFTIG